MRATNTLSRPTRPQRPTHLNRLNRPLQRAPRTRELRPQPERLRAARHLRRPAPKIDFDQYLEGETPFFVLLAQRLDELESAARLRAERASAPFFLRD
jgi:hypothetical protein